MTGEILLLDQETFLVYQSPDLLQQQKSLYEMLLVSVSAHSINVIVIHLLYLFSYQIHLSTVN